MKTIRNTLQALSQAGRQWAARLTLIVGLAALIPAVHANPAQEPLTVYWLTNTVAGTNGSFNLTGALAIPATTSTNLYSQPFTIWRGRGFTFNAGFWTTNTSGSNVVFNLRFASVHTTNGLTASAYYVTNWSAYGQLVLNCVNTGTNEQFFWTNIQPSSCDNLSLGQLLSVSNAATGTLWLDPTNTFVGVLP